MHVMTLSLVDCGNILSIDQGHFSENYPTLANSVLSIDKVLVSKETFT